MSVNAIGENAFKRLLEDWIEDFRSEALHQLAAGCAPADLLRIAQQVADSKQNRKAFERQQQRVPIELAHGNLPRS